MSNGQLVLHLGQALAHFQHRKSANCFHNFRRVVIFIVLSCPIKGLLTATRWRLGTESVEQHFAVFRWVFNTFRPTQESQRVSVAWAHFGLVEHGFNVCRKATSSSRQQIKTSVRSFVRQSHCKRWSFKDVPLNFVIDDRYPRWDFSSDANLSLRIPLWDMVQILHGGGILWWIGEHQLRLLTT